MTLNSGAGNGAVVDNGENIYKNNITFSNDTYSVGCNNFWWNGSSGLSFGQWQGLGLTPLALAIEDWTKQEGVGSY